MSDRSNRSGRENLLLPILIPLVALVAIAIVLFAFSRILLAVKPAAATATALTVAAAIIGVAAFVSGRRRVETPALGAFVGAVAGVAMLAGGVAIAVIGPPEPEIEPQHLTLAAPKGAVADGFSTDALSAEPGKPIDLEFDNSDAGIGHNVVIFDGPDDKAPTIFEGDVVTGPTKAEYHVKALTDGSYFFHCEIHPTTMTGTLTVEKGAGGIKLVAKNTSFEEKELTFPAGQTSTLSFDNEDPFEHNFSIYEDSSASGQPLFTVDPFAGPTTKTFQVPALPPGKHYFHCDIHPTMHGTVIVAPPEGGEGGPSGSPPAPPGGG
jgi:plastocyanin